MFENEKHNLKTPESKILIGIKLIWMLIKSFDNDIGNVLRKKFKRVNLRKNRIFP